MQSRLIFLTLILLTSFGVNAKSELCSNYDSSLAAKCPNGVSEISLCFIDPETDKDNPLDRLNQYANCAGGSKKVISNQLSSVKEELAAAIQDCKVVKDLRFAGHGAPGLTQAGGLTSREVSQLKDYNCAIGKGAEIDLIGCNTGRGCLGQLFMFNVAKSLLPKGGKVIGNTYYASVILPYPAHISLNGKRRVLDFDPAKAPPDNWNYKIYPAIQYRQTAAESCIDELDESLKYYENHKAFSKVNGDCKLPSEVDKMAEEIRKKRQEFAKLEQSERSFESISGKVSGSWWQGKIGKFSGISDLGNDFINSLQPYISCRRRIVSGRYAPPQVPSDSTSQKSVR